MFSEFSVIFAKDMAYYLSSQMEKLNEVLPEGYLHTFLIRHPRKTVASLYKASLNDSTEGEEMCSKSNHMYFDQERLKEAVFPSFTFWLLILVLYLINS